MNWDFQAAVEVSTKHFYFLAGDGDNDDALFAAIFFCPGRTTALSGKYDSGE